MFKFRKRSYFFWILCTFLAYIGLGHVYYYVTGGFNQYHVLKAEHEWDDLSHEISAEESKNLEAILSQKFRYLTHGNQSYVFMGEHNQHVLKLFKADFLKRQWFAKLFPPIPPFTLFLYYKGKSQTYRLQQLVSGYAIAFAYDRNNTGLLYVHLDGDNKFPTPVTIIDGLGAERTIFLNHVCYVVQKKVESTREVLTQLLKQGDLETVKVRLKALFQMYLEQYRNGLFDEDHNLFDNTGFIGEIPIRQDVGKLVIDCSMKEPQIYQDDILKLVQDRLKPWLYLHFPLYADALAPFLLELEQTGK